ncbi:Cyclin-dependent protein kinase inhibitor SMR1 [Hirschfeldia incana]|nr:Cyclin-dependent protein kinase inhibitor SMR1 [Hirschfeldia incana]
MYVKTQTHITNPSQPHFSNKFSTSTQIFFSKHKHTFRDMDDLELLQDLSKFNFPASIKIPSKTSKDNKDGHDDNDEGFSCSTPTSQEHKIPSVHDSPPPPPRKPRALPSKPSPTAALMIRSCKRKLLVSTPDIIMNKEEIDRFFSSVYSDTSTTAKRRRRYLYCARR